MRKTDTAYHKAGNYIARRYFSPDDCLISILRSERTVYDLKDLLEPLSLEERAELERRRAKGPPFIAAYDPAKVEQKIVILYAGAAAELRLRPTSKHAAESLREPTLEEQAELEETLELMPTGSDWERAERFLTMLAPDRTLRTNLRERCRTRAMALIAEHWHDIEVIAAELLKEPILDADAADMILHLVNGDPDIESTARSLVLRLGPEKATEILARHGYNLALEERQNDDRPLA